MNRNSSNIATDKLKELYDEGYKCINYEIDGENHLFTVYLKNFEKEDTRTIECNAEEGKILKNYIDGLSQ